MENTTRNVNKVLKQIIEAIITTKRKQSFRYLIAAIDLFIYVFILIQPSLATLVKQNAVLAEINNVINGTDILNIVIFWIFFSIMSAFTSMVVLHGSSNKKYHLIKNILASCYFFLQASVTLVCFNAFRNFWQNQQIVFSVFYIFILPFIFCLLYFDQNVHYFGVMTFVNVLVFNLNTTNIWLIYLSVLTVLFLLKKRSSIQTFGYRTILFAIVWRVCFSTITSVDILQLAPFLFIIFMLFVCSSAVEENQNGTTINERMLKTAKKYKKQTETIQLTVNEKIAFLTLLKTLQNFNKQNQTLKQINKKIIQNKTQKNDVLQLLELNIKAQTQINKWMKVQILLQKNASILEILRNVNTISASTLLQKFKLEQLKARVEEHLNQYTDKSVDVVLIQKINAAIIQFYENIYQLAWKIMDFWEIIVNQSVSETDLQAAMFLISQTLKKTQQNLNFLTIHIECSTEHLVFWQLYKLVDSYIKKQINFQKKEQKTLQNNYCDFILASKNKILDISYGLYAQLQNSKQNAPGSTLYQLLPQPLVKIMIKKLQKHDKEQLIVPLISNNKVFHKKISIHLLPDLANANRTLFVFQNSHIEAPTFLYDLTNDRIMYFSNQFFQSFEITKKEEDIKSRPNHFLNIDLSLIETRQNLINRQHIVIDVSMITKYSLFQSKVEMNSAKGYLKLLTHYQDDQGNGYLFLQLKRDVRAKRHRTGIFSTRYRINPDKDNHNQHQNSNDTFCKIKNPMQEVLLQKILTLRNGVSYNSFFQIIVLTLFIAIVAFTAIGFLYSYGVEGQTNYSGLIEWGDKLNKEYQSFILAMIDSYLRYHAVVYPNDLLSWNPQLNATVVIQEHERQINELFNFTLNDMLNNPLAALKPEMQYQLNFSSYNYSATNIRLDAINLMQEIKKSFKTLDISFMVNNYQAISSLQNSYMVSSFISTQPSTYYENSITTIIIALTAITTATLLIYLILCKIKVTITMISQYFLKVQNQQINKILYRLQYLIKEITILKYISKFNAKERDTNSFLDQKIQIESKIKSLKLSNHAKALEPQSVKYFLCKNYVFLLILLILTAAAFAYIAFMVSKEQIHNNILLYQSNIQTVSNDIINSMADALNSVAQNSLYNLTNNPNVTQIGLTADLDAFLLPSQFQEYVDTQSNLYSENLCIHSPVVQSSPMFKNITCEFVSNGALVKGFTIVSESYRMGLLFLKETKLNDLFSKTKMQSVYPIYIQGQYVRQIMFNIIQKISDSFMQTARTYNNKSLNFLQSIIAAAVLVFTLTLLIIARGILKFRTHCKQALALLRSIPKSVLLNIKNAKEIMHQNLLNRLNQL